MDRGSSKSVPHDYRQDGSRAFGTRQFGRLTMWFEESAVYHWDGTTSYGIDLHRSTYPTFSVLAGRWAWRLAW